MTVPLAPPAATTAVDVQVRPGSRAARLRQPRAVDVVKDLATEHGVCARPVTLRRTDLDTGHTVLVDVPCGATLAVKCPACAARAVRLRRRQIREGWHRADEPVPPPEPATDDQAGLIRVRAHLEFDRAHDATRGDWAGVEHCDDAIDDIEKQITTVGLRGHTAPPHREPDGTPKAKPRKRSTRRRQDVPDLPRRTVEDRTIGTVYTGRDGKQWRPSLFLTLTLPSYGRVWHDGTPTDPDTYDYRAAAWDAVHFPRLLDRFWQNLRRAVGWNVQYAGAVEPQRRLAPHVHFAVRGTMARELVRKVAAATYHQVWWPPCDQPAYRPDRPPRFDYDTNTWIDPDTGRPLTPWTQAVDTLDTDPGAVPVHVVRFGAQVHAHGVLAGTDDADRCVRYITRYLTKHTTDIHQAATARQRTHQERLWRELQTTPCSARCANWLLYGIAPKGAHGKLHPGRCRARVHQHATLGLGGRRVLVSRQWSGKTLADHRYDTRAWVRHLLNLPDTQPEPGQDRYTWEKARPHDPDLTPLGHRLLRAVSERIQLRNHLHQARTAQAAQLAGPAGTLSATTPDNRHHGAAGTAPGCGPPQPATPTAAEPRPVDVSATATGNRNTTRPTRPSIPTDPAQPANAGKRPGVRGDSPAGRRVGEGGTAPHADNAATTPTRPHRLAPTINPPRKTTPRQQSPARPATPAGAVATPPQTTTAKQNPVRDAIQRAIQANIANAPPLTTDQHQRLAWLLGTQPTRPANRAPNR